MENPDARWLVVSRRGRAWLVRADGGREIERGELEPGEGRSLESEDGAGHALLERDERVLYVDGADELAISPVTEVTRSAEGWVGARAARPRFSPKGHVLATLERDDGARSVGKWVPRSKRWSVLARGELCDVHPEEGWLVFTRDAQVWLADPRGRHARSLGEGSFGRWKGADEPLRAVPEKEERADRPSSAPTAQVVAPPPRREKRKPSAEPAPKRAPPKSAPPREAEGERALFTRVADEPEWPEAPSSVPDVEPTSASTEALRAVIRGLLAALGAYDAEPDPGELEPLAGKVLRLKRELLEKPQRVLGAVASDRSSLEAITAAQVLILRYGHPAAQWVVKNGPLEPAIEWATRENAAWLPPIADDLASRSPRSLRRLWPHLTKNDATARLLRKRLERRTLEGAERRWTWARFFELSPREAVLVARHDKDDMVRLIVAQKLVLAGDGSDPEGLAFVIHSSVPEARLAAYELMHAVDPARAWGYARATLRAVVERWRSSATAWAVHRPEPAAARYFFEAIRLWPHRFISAFATWAENTGRAIEEVSAALDPNERACVAILRGDEAAFHAWVGSEPEERDRELPVLVACAHRDDALASRVVRALAERAPPVWLIEPLVRVSKRVDIDHVARLARAHPEAARRGLEALARTTSSTSEQVRGLKLLYLLGGESATEAKVRGATHLDPYVRSLLAGFITERDGT